MQLEQVVDKHFEVRQLIRQRELAALEERLEDMRQRVESREAARDDLIQQRIDTLTRQEQSPEW